MIATGVGFPASARRRSARQLFPFFSLLVAAVSAGAFGQAEEPPKDTKSSVSTKVADRSGHALRPEDRRPGSFSLPPGISIGEPLNSDQAVAIALWNNPGFQVFLSELELARADRVEAGLLLNPSLQALLPLASKPFELVVQLPLQAFWERPRRVAAADANLNRVEFTLVQSALDLIQNVRLAYGDTAGAGARGRLAAERAANRAEIAELTQLRLRGGDIGEREAMAIHLDALNAATQQRQIDAEAETFRLRLQSLLAYPPDRSPLAVVDPVPPDLPDLSQQDMIDSAHTWRADLQAAQLAVEAAGQRLGWQSSRTLGLISALLSSKEIGTLGLTTGPGISAEIPVFNRNQGGISRAQAELEQASLNYLAVSRRVDDEVRLARHEVLQSLELLKQLRSQVIPAVQETIELAEKAYAGGDISYLELQQAKTPLFDTQLQEADLQARAWRARIALEHALGKSL